MFADLLLSTQKKNLRQQEKEKKATALQFVLFYRNYWIGS